MKSMKSIIIGAILFGVTTGGNEMKWAKKVAERLKENKENKDN